MRYYQRRRRNEAFVCIFDKVRRRSDSTESIQESLFITNSPRVRPLGALCLTDGASHALPRLQHLATVQRLLSFRADFRILRPLTVCGEERDSVFSRRAFLIERR